MKSNEHKDEVEIPIMRYALDIIKKWQFNFPILKYVTGKSGYNVKIRKLLDQIDREVKVFDKDSFSPDQFNGAIIKARQNNINCAWSNEAFELWYLLHFHNRVTAMSREEYKKAISDAVNTSPKNKKKKKDYEYAKNAPNNYDIINQYGNQNAAIRWAKSLHDQFEDQRFHTHNPCTLVYKLVLQLIGEDDDLNSKLISKIES